MEGKKNITEDLLPYFHQLLEKLGFREDCTIYLSSMESIKRVMKVNDWGKTEVDGPCRQLP